jgi:DNA replication protein DnaC
MDTPQVLLEHYLKHLRLPTMVREYRKLGEQCAKEGATFEVFLLRLVESEMMDRERRATERRIKAAKFPVSKSLESYNFLDMPTLNKKLVVCYSCRNTFNQKPTRASPSWLRSRRQAENNPHKRIVALLGSGLLGKL